MTIVTRFEIISLVGGDDADETKGDDEMAFTREQIARLDTIPVCKRCGDVAPVSPWTVLCDACETDDRIADVEYVAWVESLERDPHLDARADAALAGF